MHPVKALSRCLLVVQAGSGKPVLLCSDGGVGQPRYAAALARMSSVCTPRVFCGHEADIYLLILNVM